MHSISNNTKLDDAGFVLRLVLFPIMESICCGA